MKLPKIVLKSWIETQLTFKVFGTHTTPPFMKIRDISDVNKMAYLFGLLEEPAYSAVKGNYKEMIDVLHERFG